MNKDDSSTESRRDASQSPWVVIEGEDALQKIWDSINSIRTHQLEARDANVRLSHTLQQLLTKVQSKLEALDTTLQRFEGEVKTVRLQSSANTGSLKEEIDSKLEALGDMVQCVQEVLDEKSSMDIRQQNRRIRRHIPFTFQPRSSKLHSNV